MGRGAGVKPVGPNSQLLPKICFASFPNTVILMASHVSPNKITFVKNQECKIGSSPLNGEVSPAISDNWRWPRVNWIIPIQFFH